MGEAPEVSRLVAVAGEGHVERAVGVVAGERKVAGAQRSRRALGDDLAVALNRHRIRLVPGAGFGGPEVGRLLAVAGEGRVERAVRVVAGEGEVVARATDHDDLPVVLQRHPPSRNEAPEIRYLPAVAGEARVERAVRVVAGEGDASERGPDRDDLAVGLAHGRRRRAGAETEGGRPLAVAGEGRVEAARGRAR